MILMISYISKKQCRRVGDCAGAVGARMASEGESERSWVGRAEQGGGEAVGQCDRDGNNGTDQSSVSRFVVVEALLPCQKGFVVMALDVTPPPWKSIHRQPVVRH